MANPFSGIISADLKLLYNNMIDALIEQDALTRPCQLIYGITKYTECSNCEIDPVLKRSANLYRSGGPAPFTDGQICPMCGGAGLIPSQVTETVYLGVIWNYKKFLELGFKVDYPEGHVLTLSNGADTTMKIKQAQEMLMNTDLNGNVHHKFIREGEPKPAGFGDDRYVFTLWKRAG